MKQKNKTRLARAAMTLLLALLTTFGAWAQTTVTIGDGTSAGYYTPIGTYYNYSITEQLYTADEIGMAGTITSISFYYAYSAEKGFPITVYMANVDADDLSTGISLAGADQVFDGTLSVTGAGWVTIDLDSPFAYNGTSNLLIGINKDYVQWFSGSTWRYTSAANMARYSQNDDNAYTTETVPGTVTNYRPNIQIAITAGSGPVCDKPETLEASDVTANSVTLTWSGGSGTYNVEYKKSSDTGWTSVLENTTATTTTLTNLIPGTSYQARVQSVCSGDATSGWKSVSFSTAFGIPLVEKFGTNLPTGWAIKTGLLSDVLDDPANLSAGGYWNFGQNNEVFDNHARVNIYGGSCKYWLVMPSLPMEDNVQLSFDVAYTAYSGSNAPQQDGTDDKFVVLINDGTNWNILRQWDNAGSEYVLNDLNPTPLTVTIDLSSYQGKDVAVAFYAESTESNADNNLHIDNVSIDYIPSCPMPTNLTVNYTGGTTAEVSWTANGDADEWNVAVIDEENNYKVTRVNTNPSTTITGLELGTTYRVEVATFCGENNVSDWTNQVSFTTDLCTKEDQCLITLELTDSYGDGWNGASIKVVDVLSNKVLGQFTNTNAADAGVAQNYTLAVCPGRDIQFVWVSGSYDSECSYVVKDVNGSEIFSGSGAMSASLNYTVDCTARMTTPTELTISEIGPHSAKLSWTENGDATQWMVCKVDDDESFVGEAVIVTEKTYTLTNLDPETEYNVKVCAVSNTSGIENSLWSEKVTFTTDTATPAPTDLAVSNITPTTATATWQGFAETYDIEWAEVPTYTPSDDALWLQYDDDGYTTSIGNSTAATWTWGVMYPSDELQGNSFLHKIAIYEVADYYTMDSYTVNIYTGGNNAPGTLVGTETVVPSGQDGIHEIRLAMPITIDPTKNLWITVTAYGTYVMSSCTVNNDNNQWVYNNGTWADIGDLASSLADYGWMIRGFVDSTAPDYDWNSVTGVTSPYTITNLDPETDYVVRVKGKFGTEGYSNWATTSFTTPSVCDAPNTLAVNNVTHNSATLSWVGYQDSYNVQLIIPTLLDESKLNTFTQVGEDKTATGELTEYSFDLSGFSGTGCIAIRHYNVSDQFRLNIDDIEVTNAGGTSVLTENFESGEIPATWVNYDADGDYYIWNIWKITQKDGQGNDVGNGNYCATSASWVGGSVLHPDNWLIIPNVPLGGTLKFLARGQDPSCPEEVFGVFISTDPDAVIVGTSEIINNVTSPYIFEDLQANVEYKVQVQGISETCGGTTEWSAIASFETLGVTNITFAKEGYATYYNGKRDVVLPAGMKAYAVSAGGTSLTYAQIADGDDTDDNLVPARTAMLLEVEPAGADQNISIYLARPSAAAYSGTNLLHGSDVATTTTGGAKFYKLTYGNDGTNNAGVFGWYWGAANGAAFTSPANKAWLALPASTPAPFFGLPDDSNTTGIMTPQTTTEDGEWYTLQGMKVGKKPTTAGVYIHNGRKFVIK